MAKLSLEQIDKIKKMLSGHTDAFIANYIGDITRERIRQIRNIFQIKCEVKGQRCSSINEEKLGKIIQMLPKQINLKDIFEENGMHYSNGVRILKKYNIDYKNRRQGHRELKPITKSGSVNDFLICYRKYKHNKNWSALMAKELGVVQSAIYSRIRALVHRKLIDKSGFKRMRVFIPYHLQ